MRPAVLDRLDQTIVAASSAPGHAPLGVVRLSGPRALAIAGRMSSTDDGRSLSDRPGSTRTPGQVAIDDDLALPAHIYLFRQPHSYTRQDLVEFHTIGSPSVLDMVRTRAVALGALPAEPGEFTARAFLSGRMSLTTAEAVAGVIRAQSDTQLRAARRMMDGSLTGKLLDVRSELAELTGLVEADIDFAEEPIDFISPSALRDRLDNVRDRLAALLASSTSIERFETIPHILLLGAPNAGKSSLINQLSGTRRAICAAVAGTTRDILSAPARLGRTEVILLDSAGVDRSADEILTQARAISMATAERVDLVCVVVDLTAPDETLLVEIRSLDLPPTVLVANKCDLLTAERLAEATAKLVGAGFGPVVRVSALTGYGLGALGEAIQSLLGEATTTALGEAILVTERQREAIETAAAAVARAMLLAEAATETIDCADLLAFELRESLDALGAVTGEVTTEDLLGQVFANFCIGK